jgi:hypothetical protein
VRNANIEDTLIAAAFSGMEQDDLRVLALLITWLEVHHPYVNADRLLRAASVSSSQRSSAMWSAVSRMLQKDRRFGRFSSLYKGARLPLLRTGNDFQMARRGEDPRFTGSCLAVPEGVLRSRSSDVLAPAELASFHRGYRTRIIMGPSYRADMWAALETDSTLSAAELARRAYGSFATAWQVKRDFALVHSAPRGVKKSKAAKDL